MKNINLWFTFFLTGCVDVVPLPVDGQVYNCAATLEHGQETEQLCGPLDSHEDSNREMRTMYPDASYVECWGTRKLCAYD